MPVVYSPLNHAALLMVLSLLCVVFSLPHMMLLFLPAALMLMAAPRLRVDKPLLLLSLKRNALRRFIWLRRLAYWGLMATLTPIGSLLLMPIGRISRLMAFSFGGLLGLISQRLRVKRDPSTDAALGELLWLLGLLGAPVPNPFVGCLCLFSIALGIVVTFHALSRLYPYLNPMASCLLKEKTDNALPLIGLAGAAADMAWGVMLFCVLRVEWLWVLTLGLCIPAALRFPLCLEHLNRLESFFTSRPVQKQLTPWLYCTRKRRHLIFVVRHLVRIILRGRVEGEDNLPPSGESGVVYLCNHGYTQGTILSRAWFNRPFRSWSISDLMVKEDAYPHIRMYQVDPRGWIPSWLKEPVAKLLVRAFGWLFDSLDSIPVYRNRPRKLMETFRETADALECGDAVMIYPENPDDPSLETPGYLTDDIGPFFTGFTLIGSLYHHRTEQAVKYVPMYCSKKRRTLVIGQPICFDPANDPILEKERIVTLARDSMVMMMHQLEAQGAAVSA